MNSGVFVISFRNSSLGLNDTKALLFMLAAYLSFLVLIMFRVFFSLEGSIHENVSLCVFLISFCFYYIGCMFGRIVMLGS